MKATTYHISISNKSGTVRYIADNDSMRKTDLPKKILQYIDAMPNLKTLYLYSDQLSWLTNTASSRGTSHSSYNCNSFHQLAREVLTRMRTGKFCTTTIDRD